MIAKFFTKGDVVRKPGNTGKFLSPYTGTVLSSNEKTGAVIVQWPWGTEQEFPSELVLDTSGDFAGQPFDSSYSSWDMVNSNRRTASDNRISVHACKLASISVSEDDAIFMLNNRYSCDTSSEVNRVYEHGKRLASYWTNSHNKYHLSIEEIETGKFFCPRCKFAMDKSKDNIGQKTHKCDKCKFVVYPHEVM